MHPSIGKPERQGLDGRLPSSPSSPSPPSSIAMMEDSLLNSPPTPVFVYGLHRLLPMLALTLTGSINETAKVMHLVRQATILGYQAYRLHSFEYPGALKQYENEL